jgi:kojibiose phosphorylase
VNEDSFDTTPKKMHSQETVFTIGNGYFCTRGTFEEGYPRATTATLLFGVFDSVPIAKEELANAPDWTVIQLFLDGERFRLDRGKILSYSRSLNMENGILQRTVHWESPTGHRIHVSSERFASLADEHVGIIRYSVSADEANTKLLTLDVRASLNTAQGNYDVMHFETLDQGHEHEQIWLQSETKKSKVQIVQAMSFVTDNTNFSKTVVDSDIEPGIRLSGQLAPGEKLTTEKVVVTYTSRDGVDALATAQNSLQEIVGQEETHPFVYDKLVSPHEAEWKHFWQDADVILEGDDQAQIGLRYSLYQLRINTSTHDSRYSIAAKGMTGFGYRGHVFHDTEIFMLPFFIHVMPDVARNLLLYRYHLLPAARKKAASNGYEGAQYPWESTLDGEETTPASIIHPETGEVIPVLNGFIELHITSSIAHAFWEYWRVTGDDDFMRDYGTELMLSTATFWASRAEKRAERNDYEITNVIGPDEWHEHVNNNAHTNQMAKRNIQTALYTYEWLQRTAPDKAQELTQQLDLSKQHVEHMYDVADHLYFPQDPDTKFIEQFDGFSNLQHLDREKYRGRKDSYQGILGIEAVQKYQIVKQADVLMLLTMLDLEFDRKTKEVNWDYYYPITDHDYGSSLTPALHVILACELDRLDDVYTLFMKGARVDLDNLRGNTPEGVHAACAGAVWQAAVLGCAGLRVTDDGYTTKPSWPAGWTRLAFNFKRRGETIHVDLHR